MFHWVRRLLIWFGLFHKKANIVLLGLDNAGKTTLLHYMKQRCIIVHEPTRHPQQDTFEFGSIRFHAHDLGGHTAARRLWQSYYAHTDAIVFIIDMSDGRRWIETKAELTAILADNATQNMPILILANKMDITPHMNFDQVRDQLNLNWSMPNLPFVKHQKIHVEPVSIIHKSGVETAFEWLTNQI